MRDSERVRRPAVAGMFYPGDPEVLRSNLDSLLSSVREAPAAGRPIVLVEPHAGYQYSGRVAAHGYKLLLNRNITTVVVISPSHLEYFAAVSVFSGDAYETPLGRVPIDIAVADALASADPLIEKSLRGHVQDRRARGEHALEVQLPFLQAVLPACSIVPVVMGDQSWGYCRALGNALGPLLKRQDVLIVASSDLSHFYPDDVARKLDGVFLDELTAMDPRRLYESVQAKSCEACGAGPVIASIIAASHLEAQTCRVLATANSGDTTGDRSQVVGYAAAVVLESREATDPPIAHNGEFDLNETERDYLLGFARRAIEQALGITGREPAKKLTTPALGSMRGGFVTLKIGKRLRGCIGTIESSKPIAEMVAEMARAAAFSDPRFTALNPQELSRVRIEISILSPLRRIRGPESIEVGRDGLVVQNGERRGLLLPQVAEEFRWDAITFLERTCEKAGLAPEAWTDASSEVYTYTAIVFGEVP